MEAHVSTARVHIQALSHASGQVVTTGKWLDKGYGLAPSCFLQPLPPVRNCKKSQFPSLPAATPSGLLASQRKSGKLPLPGLRLPL